MVGVAPTNSINETFEQHPLQGWELGPGIQVQQIGQGHALAFSQPGAAWLPVVAQDLTLSFKYRPGRGIMEVIFCAAGEPPNQRGYHLMLMPGEIGWSGSSARATCPSSASLHFSRKPARGT